MTPTKTTRKTPEKEKMETEKANRNETLADLAEAVRKMARDMEENADWKNDVIVVDHTLVEGFNNLADRIDAAAKRETVAGNAAKLREAAQAWMDYWTWGGYDGLREHRLKTQTKAALSAPPRNCDRFATAEEAIAAHKQAETNCPPADCPECPYIHGRKSGVDCLTAWIFAPAAQEGGGDHESK